MSRDIVPMNKWPALLPMHIAEYESSGDLPLYTLEEIAEHFDITVQDIEVFSQQMLFREEVRAFISEIKDSTSVVRQKAKAQLELYLDTLVPVWMVDPDFPPAEKNKTLKFVSELAEAGGSAAQKASAKIAASPEAKAANLNIYMTLPGGETKTVEGVIIEQEPEEVEIIEIKKPEDKDGE